ncbi:MAG: hypothetical protein J6S87_05630 [Bacteroidales bacterium]|nr:hypothetical protein [Bacteroidales bacterium]
MKKFYFWSVIIGALMLSVPAQAQFERLTVMTPHYYPGEIYYSDGHREAYDEVELPRVGKSKLGVKKNKDDKQYTDIEAVDIIGVKLWHPDFPDKQHVIYFVHAKKEMMQNAYQWGTPVAGSKWGVLYQCEMNYEIDKKTGDLNIIKFTGGSGPDTPTLYYLKRPQWNEAVLLIWNYSFYSKKKVAEFFSSKKKIYEGVKSGKLKASDIQYILDQMAGGKKEEVPLQTIPSAQIDTVANGVTGDDE